MDLEEAVARAIFDTAIGAQHWDNPFYAEEREGCFRSARAAIKAVESYRRKEGGG
jgi:hypothetical protein